ncbi:MAG: glycosyltransferase family 2 protein [Roseibium sp.]|uniref:glycosyltransferase family 2 protein n=1 Tax=Roseibium sp. TaxID=1936156 RepID=UPI002627C9E1|nr:glycosyltransferase family 2 protein [Roseibium sp.]MCV0425179.1 glycosyltransferase family 2 protein [Roseibium sp.]
MLETVGTRAEALFDVPQILQLAPEVCLVVWDPPHPVSAAPQLEEQAGVRFKSVASVRLPRLDGRSRLLWIFSVKEQQALHLQLSAGVVGSGAELVLEAGQVPQAADPYALTHGLTQNACVVLVTTMLNTWSGIFRLGRSRRFVGFATDLLRSVNDAPSVADCVASVGTKRVVETILNGDCQEISSAVLIGSDGITRLTDPFCNVLTAEGKSRLLVGTVDLPRLPEDSHLVLSGSWGLAIRRLELQNGGRSLSQWWACASRKPAELRDYLISTFGEFSPASRAAVLDLQTNEPLAARRHGVLGDTSPFCAIETALAGEAGVLAGGWMRDPGGSYDGINLLDGAGDRIPLDLHTFDGVLPESQGGYRIKRFVAFSPVGKSLRHHLQPRFELKLASGDSDILVPPPQPSDLAEIRSKALSVVPPRQATDEVIETCLATPFSDLQNRICQATGQPLEILIGEQQKHPIVSIVIPLYKVLEFLKSQLAAFAADRWLVENGEVILVLDSPEQAVQVEDLLAGFYLLYGLPVRLIVMERNSGYALACNAGAEQARGRYLAMINSDVVPLNSGWLEQLCASLMMDESVGAVGAKLLYADNAIQHAGLKFIQDEKARWFNHHYFKGFPRRYQSASQSREVPGVTGACLIVSRADFEAVNGFSTDYIIGDYEDSDLCLKVRQLNRKIYYIGDVELYHFERVSIKSNADYTRGVASQYNRWFHQTRWQDVMSDLMTSIGSFDRVEIR